MCMKTDHRTGWCGAGPDGGPPPDMECLEEMTTATNNMTYERSGAPGSGHGAARAATDDLADFLDNAPVPIHSVDSNGVIVYANRAELELLGYSADEYVGQPVAAFHVDAAVVTDLLDRVGRGETLRDCEADVRAKDGSIRHVVISSNMLVAGGKPVGTRCFMRDVTDRMRAEDERDHVIADLSRTVRLNDMFASILGHDLRGPLSTIVMAAELLVDQI